MEQNIDVDTMINYVINLLKQYDKNVKMDIQNKFSPYRDKIIMEYNNRKIEIPREIQNSAINKWDEINTNKIFQNKKIQLEKKIEKLEKKIIEQDKNINTDYSYYYAIAVFFIIIVAYYLYRYCKN